MGVKLRNQKIKKKRTNHHMSHQLQSRRQICKEGNVYSAFTRCRKKMLTLYMPTSKKRSLLLTLQQKKDPFSLPRKENHLLSSVISTIRACSTHHVLSLIL
ncbi:melanoma antigen recognized by T-cells 1 isoform X3 [Petaurus breviceps papuanus]|uniref:melanoma antigen recognized by T-cells 1 isoform X3 n=1 Tax=Petaurus breviceps papuanus TaxID=3040969 RepID=UPI0036DAD37D